MNDSSELFDRIRELVSEMAGVPVSKIHPDTRLEEDLGMTGIDSADFLEAFAKEFDIDLTGLDFHKHSGPEGCNPFFHTPDWLKDHGNYPVTVDHLVRVAQIGRWFSPPRV